MAARKAADDATETPETDAPNEVAQDGDTFASVAGAYAAAARETAETVMVGADPLREMHVEAHQYVPGHPASMLHLRRLNTAFEDLASAAAACQSMAAGLAAHLAENES